MTVFLTSNPYAFGPDGLKLNPANGFLDRLRDTVPVGGKCLFVCSGPDRYDKTDHYSAELEQVFREAGLPFSEVVALDGRNAEDAERWVSWSDVMILAGGHVPTQNDFFRKIGLAELVRDYPGVVIGISAGSMNSASRVYAQPEVAGESVDPDYLRFRPGLGLTSVNILPHYGQCKELILDGQRLFEDITYADSMGNCFTALLDGSYVWIRDGNTQICGEAWQIKDGILTQLCTEGNSTVL